MAFRLVNSAQRGAIRVQLPATRYLCSSSTLLSSFDSTLASSTSNSNSRLSPTLSSSSLSSIPIPSRAPPPPTASPTTDTLLLSRLARLVMKSGKLARAHSHLDTMLQHIHLTTQSPPLPILHRALQVASPSIRIVGRRKGTKSLPTPQPLTTEQRLRQAWLWIVEASDKRQGAEKIFGKRLAQEVLAVLSGQSEAIKKKEARHMQGVVGRANVGR
ncbi:ribosomal protein S7 domain-containing protein [Leucosporidium creatinivorum]|uniref:Ribosomal protein S7 domain-containing protein n=1 Tax=Leucosporidium creatinivorum TaxID=106004 RepID=A0A1Y2E085_9BASI|nr:ribosomal protein S7 domain-containing protein [Leucosporidium creatinivorum]